MIECVYTNGHRSLLKRDEPVEPDELNTWFNGWNLKLKLEVKNTIKIYHQPDSPDVSLDGMDRACAELVEVFDTFPIPIMFGNVVIITTPNV
jgi:hypothetical protein